MSEGIRLFVPGRLCLLGEHSDWAAGYRRSHPEISPGGCLVVGTDQGIEGEAHPAPGVLEIASRLPHGEEIGPARMRAEPEALDQAARGADFFSYVAGVAAEAQLRHGVGGLRLEMRSGLPVRKGLSSSAAACVFAARAFSRAYGLGLSVEQEMDLAYRGERRTGSACGRMDQVCAYGRRVSHLRFDGDALAVDAVEPGGVFHLLVVDLRRGKDTRRILADLNACFPATPGALAARVRQALGEANLALLGRARAALESGDAPALGAVLGEAQAIFDAQVAPASEELRAPRLHEVLAHPAVAELGHGAKGVGSQGDGCAQIVARSAEARRALAARLEREEGVHCLPLTITPGAAGGPGVSSQAVPAGADCSCISSR